MNPEALRPMLQALDLPLPIRLPPGPVAHADGTRSWWAVDPAHRAARLAAGPGDLFDRHPAARPAARATLAAALDEARRAYPGARFILAGYSQGGMLAMDHLLLHGEPDVQALVLLSSTCIALDEWRPRLQRLRGLPVLVAHGRHDADLAFSAGERLRDLLGEAGAAVTWLPFDGGHEMPLVVWRALRRFVLGAQRPIS